MRAAVLVALLGTLVFASPVWGASYQLIGGGVVDPILCRSGGGSCSAGGAVHPYSGPNLQSGANHSSADLSGASLSNAQELQEIIGIPDYDALTDFTEAWSGAPGNSPFFDPEPPLGLLTGLGLLGLAAFRRRSCSY